MDTRKCKECEETLPIENFGKDYRGCTRTRCMPCYKVVKKKQKKEWYEKNKEAVAKENERYRRSVGIKPRVKRGPNGYETSVCRVCDIVIPQDELSPSQKGLKTSICKPCSRERGKNRYKENPKVREYHRQRYLNNREEAIRYSAQWKKDNPEKRREHKRKYRQKINERIRRQQSKRVSEALKSIGCRKKYSVLKYLGCTAVELIKHLEGQFQDGMNWDNYGVNEENWKLAWQIDHIKPLNSFDLSQESEQMACFNYTNLQPLWAEENLRKSDSYDEEND
jgi:hypothetical protein